MIVLSQIVYKGLKKKERKLRLQNFTFNLIALLKNIIR